MHNEQPCPKSRPHCMAVMQSHVHCSTLERQAHEQRVASSSERVRRQRPRQASTDESPAAPSSAPPCQHPGAPELVKVIPALLSEVCCLPASACGREGACLAPWHPQVCAGNRRQSWPGRWAATAGGSGRRTPSLAALRRTCDGRLGILLWWQHHKLLKATQGGGSGEGRPAAVQKRGQRLLQ